MTHGHTTLTIALAGLLQALQFVAPANAAETVIGDPAATDSTRCVADANAVGAKVSNEVEPVVLWQVAQTGFRTHSRIPGLPVRQPGISLTSLRIQCHREPLPAFPELP